MTEVEYNAKIKEICKKEEELREERRQIQEEYLKTLNSPWKDFIFKKVKVRYTSRISWKERTEKETICYWGGIILKYGQPCLTFYQIKKDGTQSSREANLGWEPQIISMEMAD